MNKNVADLLGVTLSEFAKGNVMLTAQDYINALNRCGSAYEAIMKMYLVSCTDERVYIDPLLSELNNSIPRIYTSSYDKNRWDKDILIWVATDDDIYIIARYKENIDDEVRDLCYGVVFTSFPQRGYMSQMTATFDVSEELLNRILYR